MPTRDPSLLARTLQLLKKATESNVTYLEIYENTNLTPHWLSQLSNAKISDPSVRRVQALHDYLSGVVQC